MDVPKASALPILKKVSEIPVLPQPVSLGWQVAVYDITFLILKTPWGDNQDIAFAYPCALFDFSFNPAHSGYAVVTPDPYMVCSHHEVRECKLLISPFLGQADPDDRRSVRVYCVWIYIIVVIIGSNSDNSFVLYMTLRTMKVCIV
jgi:hypothetical protein